MALPKDFQRLGYFGGHHLVDHPALVLCGISALYAVPQVAHKRKVRPPAVKAKVSVMA
jgi:hypothetical protein